MQKSFRRELVSCSGPLEGLWLAVRKGDWFASVTPIGGQRREVDGDMKGNGLDGDQGIVSASVEDWILERGVRQVADVASCGESSEDSDDGDSLRNGESPLGTELPGDCDRAYCAACSARWMFPLVSLLYGDIKDDCVGLVCCLDAATA